MTSERTGGDASAIPGRIGAITWVLIGVMMVPMAVILVRVITGLDGFHATSDNALNELVVRDIGSRPVLLGPFAHFGWAHPGPLMYYLLWLPYRVFGSGSSAMLVGALIINASAIVTMIAIAKRWGGFVLALPVALAAAILVVRLPDGFLENPWNPFVTVLPYGAFLLLAWAATCGDRWALPVAAFVGSFCVQTHIGYAGVVGVVLAWCVVRAVRDRAEPQIAGRGVRGVAPLIWAGVVLAIVWAPPLIEQVVHDPGNLRSIFRYFVSPPERSHTLADAYHAIGAQFSLVPDWIRGAHPARHATLSSRSTVPALLLPFAVASFLAIRHGTFAARRLAVTLLIAVLVGVVSISSIIGPMYEYRLRWVWLLAALCMAFSVATFARWLQEHTHRSVRIALGAAGAAGVCVLVAAGTVNATRVEPPEAATTAMLGRLTDHVVTGMAKRPGVVLIRASSRRTLTYVPGVALALERRGIRVKEKNIVAYRLSFGEHRLYAGEPVRSVLILAENRAIERAAFVPGARLLFYEGRRPNIAREPILRELAQRRRTGTRTAMTSRTDAQVRSLLRATAVFELPPSSSGF